MEKTNKQVVSKGHRSDGLLRKIIALMATAQPKAEAPLSLFGRHNNGGLGYNDWWKYCMTHLRHPRCKKGGK
ncbi:MAG: hypothetical protein WBL80_02860 [Erysipelotrichaceae bacterium]